jgi:hypothetical protein
MDRVSNKWLEDVIRLHEFGGIGSELDHAAFCELRDRRAAEQNVTTADLNLGPVTRLRVSDEELCRVGEVFALDSVTNSIIYGVPMRHLSLIVDEVIERRAAEREQAAPEPRKLAKWERRLDRMGHIHLAHNPDPPESEGAETWFCLVTLPGDDFGKSYAGETAKAAIAAAWKAWKEARGEH